MDNQIIGQRQYTILGTAVIGGAVVPTLIARRWFMPRLTPMAEGDPAARTGEALPRSAEP